MRQRSMAALIDTLKSSDGDDRPGDWVGLEDHVRNVYQTLVELDGGQTVVARDVQIRGRHGSSYQIDVFYELKVANITHRVAIECKNSKRPVERNDVLAFKAKLDDCPGIQGVMVAAHGYQSGAEKFATDNNIYPLTLTNLPSIGRLLGMRLESVILPSEDAVGQPFWTLFDLQNAEPRGEISGNELFGVLFFSRRQAEQYRQWKKCSANWAVRGMEQQHLRSYILTVDAMNGRYVIAVPDFSRDNSQFPFIQIDRSRLIAEFCKDLKLPAQPNVMPDLR